MLEALSPTEFESWCRIVMERHFNCRVEQTPASGDEGRDLIVYHPAGAIIVECKHYPRGTVGRPVVQKLHSAILTAGASRGMLVTTGRIATTAVDYGNSLGLDIQFVDGLRLAQMAESVGMSPARNSGASAALAVKTLSESQFQSDFVRRIFSTGRYRPGHGQDLVATVERETEYDAFYVGEYTAEGETMTAAGHASASWEDRVWIDGQGKQLGVGNPPDCDLDKDSIVPLGEAQSAAPGRSEPPALLAHDAARRMKEHVMRSHSTSVSYTGGNNQSYTKEIRPKSRSTQVSDVRLIFVPRQSFRITTAAATHVGQLRERSGELSILSKDLSECRICRRHASPEQQVLCAICDRPAHRWTFFNPDSFECGRCAATVCAADVREADKERLCMRCAPEGAAPVVRTRRQLALGVGVSVLVLGYELVVPDLQIVFTLAAAALAWVPFLRATFPSAGTKPEWVSY